jgi:CubicO group peptidase (beta-lactamase class C family)
VTINRRAMLSLGIGSAVASTLTLHEATAADADPRYREAFAELDRYVARYLREMNSPGMTLALADRAGVQRVVTYGFGDLEQRVRIQRDELFQIGSITKSFTALVLLQLRDEGKLDLHRPVTDYLPWLRIQSAFEPITPHHLLTHSSALPGGAELFASDPAEQHLAAYAPGKHFWYNNLGFTILGLLAETLDGRELPVQFRERLFKPLDMSQSEPVIDFETRRRQAKSYVPLFGDRPYPRYGRLCEAPAIISTNAAGCISATARDMGRYVRMLANRGEVEGKRLVSTEGFGLLATPHIKAEDFGPETSYGYGIAVEDLDGHRVLRHTGGMVSFMSSLWVDPESGVGGFASINAQQGYRPNPVIKHALRLMRAAQDGKRMPPPPVADDSRLIANAMDYAGTFKGARGTIVIVNEGKRLFVLQGDRRVALDRLEGDEFHADDPALDRFALAFGRSNGRVVDVSWGGDWYPNDAYQGAREFPVPAHWQALAGHYRNEDPWQGSVRVFVLKDRLTINGSPLEPEGDRYRIRDDVANSEWIRFGEVVNGRCMRLKYSGVDFWRVATP